MLKYVLLFLLIGLLIWDALSALGEGVLILEKANQEKYKSFTEY